METKICSKCKIEKSIECFSKNASKKDGLCTECKECHKIYRNNHYKNNREYYINKAKDYKEIRKKEFIQIKEKLKCEICGENRWWVLEFHHTDRKTKENDLSHLITAPKKLEEEIKKCQILCANCHRDLHFKERIKNN